MGIVETDQMESQDLNLLSGFKVTYTELYNPHIIHVQETGQIAMQRRTH